MTRKHRASLEDDFLRLKRGVKNCLESFDARVGIRLLVFILGRTSRKKDEFEEF